KTYLKNSAEDASFLRDTLSFKVNHRMGLPYIRTAFTRLFVNGAYQGLYEKYEAQDDTDFLKRMFGESGGYLYDFSPDPNGYHFEDRGSDPATYAPFFDLQLPSTDQTPSPLVALIQTVTQASDADFRTAVAKYLDWNNFITYVATED